MHLAQPQDIVWILCNIASCAVMGVFKFKPCPLDLLLPATPS